MIKYNLSWLPPRSIGFVMRLRLLARSIIPLPSAFISLVPELSSFRSNQSNHRPATKPPKKNAVYRSQACSERSSRNLRTTLAASSGRRVMKRAVTSPIAVIKIGMKMTVTIQRAQAEKRCIRIDPKSRKANLILDPRRRQGGTHGLIISGLRKLAKQEPRSGQDVVADQLNKWKLAIAQKPEAIGAPTPRKALPLTPSVRLTSTLRRSQVFRTLSNVAADRTSLCPVPIVIVPPVMVSRIHVSL
jgi:hypothetical protein